MDDEFIDDIIDDSDDIDSICLNCDKEDLIPCVIYDEYSRKRYHLKNGFYTSMCFFVEKKPSFLRHF